MNVFILATCRKPELLRFTTLVFDSIRVGFPTADIYVNGNALSEEAKETVAQACDRVGAEFTQMSATIHHEWLEQIVSTQQEPFWIVDTDMVFFASVEGWKFDTALAGWRIPEWDDEFSGCITRARLHTSLLYIDPVKLRAQKEAFQKPVADTVFTPQANLFHPLVVPLNGRRYFHDTCSLLYHAIGGTAFTDAQLDSYFHFNFGTIDDLVLPRLSEGGAMNVARQAVIEQPAKGRGLWREQVAYYERHRANYGRKPVRYGDIDQADAAEALRWNVELCRGDQEAMGFNDAWYRYCHGIDDLIDTLEDGRPTMNAEQILELFANAAVLYNSSFFVRHREMLFPVVLMVTNAFADSVRWEKSANKHQRTMANVLSTCGDEMYFMIAMIKGGWSHVREISPRIRERDYTAQHDENGDRR